MIKIIDWIVDNKEMVIGNGGLGAFLIGILKIFTKRRRISEEPTKQAPETGSNCINIQNSGDKKSSDNLQLSQNNATVHIHGDINFSAMDKTSKEVVKSIFCNVPTETREQAEKNQRSYYQEVLNKVEELTKSHEEVKRIVCSPDFQYFSKKAATQACKSESKNIHKLLSSLIMKRINNDDDELLRIICNEAVLTAEKLTENHLKILMFCFQMTRVKVKDLTDFNDLICHLTQHVVPFIDFKNSKTELDHISYAGCVTINRLMRGNFYTLLMQQYPELLKNQGVALEKLKKNEICTRLHSAWQGPPILGIDLTPVGIVLAVIYFEIVTGNRLDFKIWIN